MGTIPNGKNTLLNQNPGTLPNVSGAMLNWFQPMAFTVVTKEIIGSELVEIGTPVNFRGVIQPFTNRQLMVKPEGERAWTWNMVHSDTSLRLNVDDVIVYQSVQYRVMARKNYSSYGYLYYEVIEDWSGSGPRETV